MRVTRGRGRTRPSHALPLGEGGAPQPPAARAGDVPAAAVRTDHARAGSRPGSGRRRIAVGVAAALGGLVLLGVLLGTPPDAPGQPSSAPAATVDVATEDAVVAVLQLYAAEAALAEAVATDRDIFAVPGPIARASAMDAAGARASEALEALRQADVGPGTPAMTYADSPDHDALLAFARDLAAHARALGVLGAVHDALLGGVGTGPPSGALAEMASLRTAGTLPPAAASWADALAAQLGGAAGGPPAPDGVPGDPHALRAHAGAEWTAAAARIGVAAGPDLAAFLNGIDPAVLAALDGHPVAGPALRELR